MYNCSFCNKEFKKLQGKILHEKCCKFNPEVEQELCNYCGKVCTNHNSRLNHERLCSKNPNKAQSNLSDYTNKLQKGEIQHWAKGQTADTNPTIARITEKVRITKSTRSYSGWHQTADAKRKIGAASSQHLSKAYADGTLRSPLGVGRGKYSYFLYDNKKYMLRSTWEFIYALYLATKNIKFEVEAIRVPACKINKYAKTFISDFSVGNKVIEIKGIRSEKDALLKESFEAAGYVFEELFESDILSIKDELVQEGFNMDELLEQIRLGSTTKNYLVYEYENKLNK